MTEEEIKRKLSEVWSECLRVQEVKESDNFFKLGGDSIMAIRLVNAISKEFAIRLPLKFLFDGSTFADQIKLISELEKCTSEEQSELLNNTYSND